MKITEIQEYLIESSCPIENEKTLSHPVIAQHRPLYEKKNVMLVFKNIMDCL